MVLTGLPLQKERIVRQITLMVLALLLAVVTLSLLRGHRSVVQAATTVASTNSLTGQAVEPLDGLLPIVSAGWWQNAQEQSRWEMYQVTPAREPQEAYGVYNLDILGNKHATYPQIIDPLVSPAGWTATGETTNSYFGYSVSEAGDVNGDGFGDVFIGAYRHNNYTGKVYLYLGSISGLSSTPTFTATGETADSNFGFSVSEAGDVNGDGFGDVLVGAYGHNSSTGKVHLYLGNSSGLSSTPAFTATGEATDNYFGYSVSEAGDVNGDGYGDVIVGAYGHTNETGKVYLYLGSSSGLSSPPAFTATGEGTNDRFGYSASGAGDVNGDGYGDVIVGACRDNAYTGKVYLYLGSNGGLSSTPAFTDTGEASYDSFGASVSRAGDVNGDGHGDVFVGAFGHNSYTGKVYLYLGSGSGLSSTPAFTATGETTDNFFGASVSGAGDVNGDGYGDVLVGAWGNSGFTGKMYLYLGGGSGLSSTPAFTAAGEATSSRFGSSVSGAGDVNGDGYSDVVVGAHRYNNSTGKAYLYLGNGSGLSSNPNFTATGEAIDTMFGSSLSEAGDVNGDGYGDVLIGAWSHNSITGKVYLYLGSSSGLSSTPAFTATGEAAGDRFGFSVSGAGDVNGDGYDDVIIGASGHNSYAGKVYLYLGDSGGLSSTPALTATGEAIGDYFGYSVSEAGDVNGDGYGDILVGAYGHNSNTGKAYLFLGGSSELSRTPGWTDTGEGTSNYFGYSASGAGDANGDGFGDVLVGAYGRNSNTGKAYLYLGSDSGLPSTPDWTDTGEGANDWFGSSVSGAGDVNGDGYGDVIIGAHRYNGDIGKVYLYLGDSSGLSNSPTFAPPGEATGHHFGYSVSGAGDVNGDGLGDVLVGADGHNSNTGKAYLYLGDSSSLSSSPAFTATGEGTGNHFGYSVSGAGDVNGDSFADVFVGAPYHNNYMGKVYLYQGGGGTGRTVRALQRRGDGSRAVQPWGLSYHSSQFQVRMQATSPFGRQRVKLEIEACPFNFGEVDCVSHIGSSWTDVTATAKGVTLNETISGLTAGQHYRWRARILYAPYYVNRRGITAPPNSAHSPWRRLNGQVTEAGVRINAVGTNVYLPMIMKEFN